MLNAHEYARTNAVRFREQLKELLRIPSVSTMPQFAGDVRRAAEWLVADMQRIGLQRAETIPTAGHPIVYGEWLGAGENAPTVLAYCHYDVQPADMADGWNTQPFEPVEREGKIYARGAVDSKSHVVAQLKAAEALLTTGYPGVNIKLLFEGEEETSSANLAAFVAQNQPLLQADVCVICDGSMADREQPAMAYSLRGIVAMELEVFGPRQDLHSGHYGGTVHNPIQALAEIITRLHNADGSVAVPGFYDDVVPISEAEHANLEKALPWIENEWRQVAAAPETWGEAQYNLHERIGARPTLEINGIAGGFAGEGFKTVLPGKALAKISCRLVANQQPERIYQLVNDFVAQITPPTVRAEVRLHSTGEPALTDTKLPAIQIALNAYEKAWGKRPFLTREGGSVPIAVDLQRTLNAPLIFMAFGYKGCGAHGPNEHVYLDMWHKGIDTILYFYEDISRQQDTPADR
jgi:acetylornithine deacetylase/succinyl-diaminopimelate desuccinylase-like protein